MNEFSTFLYGIATIIIAASSDLGIKVLSFDRCDIFDIKPCITDESFLIKAHSTALAPIMLPYLNKWSLITGRFLLILVVGILI